MKPNKISVLSLVLLACSMHICDAQDTKTITVKNEGTKPLEIQTGFLQTSRSAVTRTPMYYEAFQQTSIDPTNAKTFTIKVSYPKKNSGGVDYKGGEGYTGGEILFWNQKRYEQKGLRRIATNVQPFATYSVSSLSNGTTFVVKDSGITKTP